MLPVSGAEQFTDSEAIDERPSTSQIGAYSRLERPIVPCVSPVSRSAGRNMFHRPRFLASALQSSRTGGSCQRSLAFSICSSQTDLAGHTNSFLHLLCLL